MAASSCSITNLHNNNSSPDNLIGSPKSKDDVQDEILEQFRKLTVYIEPLRGLCDLLQIKKTHLDQLGSNIELADKLTNDLTIPLELAK